MNHFFIKLNTYFSLCVAITLFVSLLNVNSLVASEQAPEYSKAIEDNSFLIEEAYNQEPGVVQHIFTGNHNLIPIKNWEFSFTQEWPLWGQTSQFSYTVLYNSFNSGEISGFGDLILNYRYQLSNSKSSTAVAPRVSIIVPTGNKDNGLGRGTPGVQFNLPASKRISEDFAVHFNVGFTLYPGFTAKNYQLEDVTKSLTYYNAGASIIWLASSKFNIMLEAVTGNNSTVSTYGEVAYFNESVINTGCRYAIDIGDLQIVPGIAYLITINKVTIGSDMFLYLSLEHPF